MRKFYCAILLVLSASQAFGADDCSSVRLDGPGGSMEHVHVKDQRELSICFAESEAQEIDAIRFSRTPDKNYGFQTSAVALASGISAKEHRNSFQLGNESCKAREFAEQNGICSQSAVENGSGDLPQDSTKNLEEAKLNSLIGQRVKIAGNQVLPSDSRGGISGCQRELAPEWNPDESGLSVGLQNELLSQSCNLERMNQTLTRGCSTRAIPPTAIANPLKGLSSPGCEIYPDSTGAAASPQGFTQLLDANLDKEDPLPVEIGFCAGFLQPGALKDGDTCGAHSALVIGRRRNPAGKCQYLIRNSWGSECTHYSSPYSKDCEEGLGNIWIDQDLLVGNPPRAQGAIRTVVPPPDLPPSAEHLKKWREARNKGFPAPKPAFGPRQGKAPLEERYVSGHGAASVFIQDPRRNLVISEDCFQPNHTCNALSALQKASLGDIGSVDVLLGADPGAAICRSLEGIVINLKDPSGNEDSFCHFRDGSVISTASLLFGAARNEEAKLKDGPSPKITISK